MLSSAGAWAVLRVEFPLEKRGCRVAGTPRHGPGRGSGGIGGERRIVGPRKRIVGIAGRRSTGGVEWGRGGGRGGRRVDGPLLLLLSWDNRTRCCAS